MSQAPLALDVGSLSPTTGPENRYSAVPFIKEGGFNALLVQARIAERSDIDIMSTKGMSTTAARLLLDRLASRIDKVLVAHDFDVSGFSISARSVPTVAAIASTMTCTLLTLGCGSPTSRR
jgi:DNA topoisomerase VI subunit A